LRQSLRQHFSRLRHPHRRVAVKGQKQGQFKGQSARPDKWIPFTSPRDIATGQASGKRQYSPIVVTKEWGAANEALPLVEFEFPKANLRGEETVFESVTLTNATISAVKQYIGFPAAGQPASPHSLEDVSFTFQKIEVTNYEGKTTFVDDWSK
jgi:type VI secretion system secreted protein Hcp